LGEIVRLASFVAGSEPEGRGYNMLVHAGLSTEGGWQASLPLVLLEWANRRSAHGFCGRFAVAGGSVALRALYFGDGSAGPVARANGVFIDDATLPLVQQNEAKFFAQLPTPTADDDFGTSAFEFQVPDALPVEVWPDLNLAWRDRHIVVNSDAPLEEVAFSALASIDPPSMRPRIRGWCTTGMLAARGNFLPIENCNLLVTHADEPPVDQRFSLAQIVRSLNFVGEKVLLPDCFILWEQLAALARDDFAAPNLNAHTQDMSFVPEMLDWTPEALGWKFIEILSHRRLAFADMVRAIADMAGLQIPGSDRAAGYCAQRYMNEVAAHQRPLLPKITAEIQRSAGHNLVVKAAIDRAVVDLLDWRLADTLDYESLLRAVAQIDDGIETHSDPDAARKIDILDDVALLRSMDGDVKNTPRPDPAMRAALWRARCHLGVPQDLRPAHEQRLLYLRLMAIRAAATARTPTERG
jgi:hypothetical protein